jgi:hypothetical protein
VDHDEVLPEEEPEWFPSGARLHSMQGIPDDAQSMGLDRNVTEGAWLAFAGSLRATKPSHRLVAWMLLAVFTLPLLLTVKSVLF